MIHIPVYDCEEGQPISKGTIIFTYFALVLEYYFFFIVKDCVTPALWAFFKDAEGAVNLWPQLKSLIYNGGLDPTLRKKVCYVVWCDVNLSDVVFVVFSSHLGLAVIIDCVYTRTKC